MLMSPLRAARPVSVAMGETPLPRENSQGNASEDEKTFLSSFSNLPFTINRTRTTREQQPSRIESIQFRNKTTMCRSGCVCGVVTLFLCLLLMDSFQTTNAFGMGRPRTSSSIGGGGGGGGGGSSGSSQGIMSRSQLRHTHGTAPAGALPVVVSHNHYPHQFFVFVTRTRALTLLQHHPRQRYGTQLFSMNPNGNHDNDDNGDGDGAIEFSDFGDDFWAGDEQAAASVPASPSIPLSSGSSAGAAVVGGAAAAAAAAAGGMTELQQVLDGYQQVKTAQLTQNWQQGNWKVRGFSLDRYSAKDDATTTTTTADSATSTTTTTTTSMDESLTFDDMTLERSTSTDTELQDAGGSTAISKIVVGSDVVVGRTDGSVFLVELGTEFWTKFESKLTLVETSNVTVAVEEQLVRNDEPKRAIHDVPFEVSHQFMAHPGNEITALLWTEHDDNDDTMVVTADVAGHMTVWSIPDVSGERVFPLRNLEAHSDRIVALKQVTLSDTKTNNNKNNNHVVLLLSASIDGSLALWDMWTGDLVYRCHMEESNGTPIQILSVDAKGDRVYLGLSTGHVVAYLVSEMVNAASEGDVCPMPNGRFLAHAEGGGVTAIACSEDANSLITGGMHGIVKQWEILTRTQEDQKTTLQQWPRLANQRMKERAHLFQGHENKITALQYHPNAILSAAVDGTVRAWSSKTGKEFFSMDGFSEQINSLCLAEEGTTLVTNGMNHFVCVHDFDIDGGSEVEDGYELEW